MIEIHEFIEKNLELAKEKALYELKSSENDLLIKKEEEAGGIFKSKKVRLIAIKKEDIFKYIKELIKDITNAMGIEVNIEAKKREDQIKLNLFSNKNPILIGKGGQTIEAIQTIVRNSVQNITGFRVSIIIDVEDYKERQHKNLEFTAKKLAKEVQRTGVEMKLDPMNSYQRRIVHNICNEFKGISTESLGEEPNRYIIIKKKD